MLTIHRSKGLEFPIVYCPYLWEPTLDPATSACRSPSTTPTRATGARSTSASRAPDFDAHTQQHLDRAARRGPAARLRRAHARASTRRSSGGRARATAATRRSARLLFARDDDGNVAADGRRTPTDAAAIERFEALAAAAPGLRRASSASTLGLPRAVERAAARRPPTLDGRALRPRARPALAAHLVQRHHRAARTRRAWRASRRRRVVDRRARDAARAAGRRRTGDDGAARDAVAARRRCRSARASARSCTACSRRPTSPRPTSTPSWRRASPRRRRGGRSSIGDPATVVAGLRAAIETPLGPLAGGVRLRDLARADRLDELDFELPLAGGDDADGPARARTRSPRVLRAHLAAGRPARRLRGPARRPGAARERARLPHRQHRPRRCGSRASASPSSTTRRTGSPRPARTLTAWHYRPAALAAEMERAHYGLQALLYTVALHRYLRWRLPGYDPERNLAGVLYLFVRGMTGPDTPVVDGAPCGVFAWRPPAALVEALSDVLDRGGARDATPIDASTPAARCGAPGLLREFNDAGVLAAADVHVARAARARSPARTDEAVAARRRARRPRAAARPRLRRPRDDPRHGDGRRRRAGRPRRAPVARRRRTGSRGCAASPLVAVGDDGAEPAAAARRHARSTSTATGARSAQVADGPARAAPRRAGAVDEARARRRPRAAVRRRPDDRQRARRGGRGACAASRWSPAARAPARRRPSRGSSRCSPSRPRRRRARRSSRSPRRPARPPRGWRRRCTTRPRGSTSPDAIRAARCSRSSASTLHRLLGWRPGTPQPLPPRPRQPAAARRRDRRRDLDGVAVADGPARRGGAAATRG